VDERENTSAGAEDAPRKDRERKRDRKRDRKEEATEILFSF